MTTLSPSLGLGLAAMLVAACTASGACAAATAAEPPRPGPFSARYEVVWKGVNVGTASLELTVDATGRYTYVSRNNARGLARMAFPGEITQVSQFTFEAGTVRPATYRADDGTDKEERDVSLSFDWTARRVRGTAEKRPVDVELRPGAQDGMSVQIALINELLQGRSPAGFWLIDKDELKQYDYVAEGTARIKTTLGELDTVIYSSRRPGSNRLTRVWYAPTLGYMPVQAERVRADRIEWSMRVTRASRKPD
jgi:hypothetical protein